MANASTTDLVPLLGALVQPDGGSARRGFEEPVLEVAVPQKARVVQVDAPRRWHRRHVHEARRHRQVAVVVDAPGLRAAVEYSSQRILKLEDVRRETHLANFLRGNEA